jgi:superfamily II DNA helicase RecQ
MPFKIFFVPAVDGAAAEAELNTFLATHRVVDVSRAYTPRPSPNGAWTFCVHWLHVRESQPAPSSGREKVDYRTVLDAPSFKIFAALRTWRKHTSAAEGVPIYAVATNEQLAAIARDRCTTRAALERVEGFGPARLTKYGTAVLEIVQREAAPTAPKPPS